MNTILWSRGGSHDGMDWDDEQTVTFDAGLKVTCATSINRNPSAVNSNTARSVT